MNYAPMEVTLNYAPYVFNISKPHAFRHADLLDGETVLCTELVVGVQPADAVRPIRLAIDELEPGEEREVRRVHVVHCHGPVDPRVVRGAFHKGVEAGRVADEPQDATAREGLS